MFSELNRVIAVVILVGFLMLSCQVKCSVCQSQYCAVSKKRENWCAYSLHLKLMCTYCIIIMGLRNIELTSFVFQFVVD